MQTRPPPCGLAPARARASSTWLLTLQGRRCCRRCNTRLRRVAQRAGEELVGSSGSSSRSSSEQEAAAQRKRLWMAALKPPMYSVGYVPVLVAAAAVFLELGTLPVPRVLGFLAAAISIIAWLNLSNDAFDASTGVDATKPESVVNLTGNWHLVFWLSLAFLLLGVGLLSSLLTSSGASRAMLAAAIVCGYVYQGPPFRLSYKGLGEPLCFLAFGPLATPAFYLALLLPASQQAAAPQLGGTLAAAGSAAATPAAAAAAAAAAAGTAALPALAASAAHVLAALAASVPPLVWGLSAVVGASTSTILFTSHFHQIDGDRAAGKRSPLVRLGVDRGVAVLGACLAGVYVAAVALVAAGLLPPAALGAVGLLSAGPAKALLDYAWAHRTEPARLNLLKRYACKWHISLGVSLAAGMVAARQLQLLVPATLG